MASNIIPIPFKQIHPAGESLSFMYPVRKDRTLGEVKRMLQREFENDANIRIVYAGRTPDDDSTIADSGIFGMSAVVLVTEDRSKMYDPDRFPRIKGDEEVSRPGDGHRDEDESEGAAAPIPSAPAPSAPVAAAVGGGGSADEGPVVNLCVRLLNGRQLSFEHGMNKPVLDLLPILREQSGAHMAEIRLIFNGREIQAEETPDSLRLHDLTTIHAVAGRIDLNKVITWDELRGNCALCHVPGAKFSPRPFCPRCRSEAVLLSANADVLSGSARWREILDVRLQCLSPACPTHNADTGMGTEQPAGIGFICQAQHRDPTSGEMASCPCKLNRREITGPDAEARGDEAQQLGLQYSIDELTEEKLKGVLQRLLGYAHLAGFEQ